MSLVGLITHLEAGEKDSFDPITVFQVTVYLTQDGFGIVTYIIEIVACG